jgi:hypothetical protein
MIQRISIRSKVHASLLYKGQAFLPPIPWRIKLQVFDVLRSKATRNSRQRRTTSTNLAVFHISSGNQLNEWGWFLTFFLEVYITLELQKALVGYSLGSDILVSKYFQSEYFFNSVSQMPDLIRKITNKNYHLHATENAL